MKNGKIILRLLLVIYNVCARLELMDIKTVEENPFIIGDVNILINPDGPLNLLRGYLFHKSGIVYNRRFFSPVIDTDYSMKKSDRSTESTHIYTYTRNPEKDRPYKDNTNIYRFKYKSTYLSEHHQQMIYMFPCVNNTLSIEPCKDDSFTRFLRVQDSKTDRMYLLAALLLLSEGINVPIKIEKSIKEDVRILLQFDSSCPSFVDLPLWLESIMPDGTRKIVYQKETEDVLEYFKRLCDEPFLSEVKKCKEPDGKKEFNLGYFLDSPKFLMQSYIFEYIDTIEQYILFVDCVHVLLEKLLYHPETSNIQKEHIKKSMTCYFIEGKVYENIANSYAADIYNIKIKIDNEAILPFTCPEMVPSYTRVPENIPENSADPIQDELLQYSDHVETMLLNLFMCLTYNPETNLCSTEHMHGASTALIEFFNKYPVPTESASQTKHRDWCKVVSRLNNPKIRYVRESRTELCGGLENILYVISELFIEEIDMRNDIKEIIDISYNTETESKWIETIQELFLNVIKYFTSIHKISIDSLTLECLSIEGGRFDVFGSVIVSFEAGGKKESIILDILPKFSKFSLAKEFSEVSEEIKNEIMSMQREYGYINKYTERIIWNYLNNSTSRMKKESPEQNLTVLNSILDKNEINRLFMFGRIDTLKYKTDIVKYFSVNRGKLRKLKDNDQLKRIAINIIGSVSLNNLEERKKILSPLIYFNNYKNHFLKIECDLETLPASEFDGSLLNNIVETMVGMNYPKEALSCKFAGLLKHSICRIEALRIFGTYKSFRMICVTLVEKYGSSGRSDIIREIIRYIEPHNAKELNKIWFLWLSYACTETPYDQKLVDYVYMYLNHVYITSDYMAWVAKIPGMNFNYILSVLEKEKYILCNDNNGISKEKYERVIDHFKTIIAFIASTHLPANPTTSRKRSKPGALV
ncbi:hypothetical protein NEIRO03_1780 [Nematocida sp. AWRm78]|nr:hypothetical protein NEIRO02_1646 [Nematocida sp. AWRm79]KAI5184652.1 hypothetical protein NEIRO03_1780 [Nematocida sp. AWRm78]